MWAVAAVQNPRDSVAGDFGWELKERLMSLLLLGNVGFDSMKAGWVLCWIWDVHGLVKSDVGLTDPPAGL